MFSTPSCGWTDVSIGGFKSRASYLTDIPYDLLNALISYYKYDTLPAIEFDAEGWNFIVVASEYSSAFYVILDKEEKPEIFAIDTMDINKFADIVVDDISGSLNEWAQFAWGCEDMEEAMYRRNELWNKLCEVKTLKRLKAENRRKFKQN